MACDIAGAGGKARIPGVERIDQIDAIAAYDHSHARGFVAMNAEVQPGLVEARAERQGFSLNAALDRTELHTGTVADLPTIEHRAERTVADAGQPPGRSTVKLKQHSTRWDGVECLGVQLLRAPRLRYAHAPVGRGEAVAGRSRSAGHRFQGSQFCPRHGPGPRNALMTGHQAEPGRLSGR
ncbi:MAG: hypothetical protein NVSMB65_02590 [Chloroflexota bacterium]